MRPISNFLHGKPFHLVLPRTQWRRLPISLADQSNIDLALSRDYFIHAFADGVVHAEVFFDPQAHLSRGISYETVLSGFGAARKRAAAELGISSELICCFLRHLPVPDCVSTFTLREVQESFRSGRVIGVGLDSSELPFPPEWFEDIFADAKALGLRRTAHAGEEGPAGYIESALDVLDVERIDHGIRLAEDPVLMGRVAKSGMLLSICPLSNVLLRCVREVKDLPIRKFLDSGIKFSINSDDPAYVSTSWSLEISVFRDDSQG